MWTNEVFNEDQRLTQRNAKAEEEFAKEQRITPDTYGIFPAAR